jgi:large conductance mechanosensitive channel
VVRGFKYFLLRGDVVVISIGLIVATAFSTLIKAFTDNVIEPIVNRAEGSHPIALGVQLGAKGSQPTFLNLGAFVAAIIYFIIFMAVVYFVIVQPYKHISARRGVVVFGPANPVKSCPACLSDDLPLAATKCRYCGTEMEPELA